MQLRFERRALKKRYALAISRGVSTGSTNLFVTLENDGYVGIGECAPGTGEDDTLADLAEAQIAAFVNAGNENESVYDVYDRATAEGMHSAALAGLDTARWDLLGKEADLPLYHLLGLGKPSVPTSITVGLNVPEVTRERVTTILRESGCRHLKIKLGSPEGLDHDRAHFEAAREAAKPFGAQLRVDANGGWTVESAERMLAWLAERDVDYVEQPLARGNEDGLPAIFAGRPLPIFVDESCRVASDVPKLADRVDGVNIKLMKCGGITGALRLIATAKAYRLKLMIGCMGESSVAISAAAALTGVMDHIDLDSHLNLAPDPATGAALVDGVVMPPERAGHGAELNDVEAK